MSWERRNAAREFLRPAFELREQYEDAPNRPDEPGWISRPTFLEVAEIDELYRSGLDQDLYDPYNFFWLSRHYWLDDGHIQHFEKQLEKDRRLIAQMPAKIAAAHADIAELRSDLRALSREARSRGIRRWWRHEEYEDKYRRIFQLMRPLFTVTVYGQRQLNDAQQGVSRLESIVSQLRTDGELIVDRGVIKQMVEYVDCWRMKNGMYRVYFNETGHSERSGSTYTIDGDESYTVKDWRDAAEIIQQRTGMNLDIPPETPLLAA